MYIMYWIVNPLLCIPAYSAVQVMLHAYHSFSLHLKAGKKSISFIALEEFQFGIEHRNLGEHLDDTLRVTAGNSAFEKIGFI